LVVVDEEKEDEEKEKEKEEEDMTVTTVLVLGILHLLPCHPIQPSLPLPSSSPQPPQLHPQNHTIRPVGVVFNPSALSRVRLHPVRDESDDVQKRNERDRSSHLSSRG
jgi:hypothetical protein